MEWAKTVIPVVQSGRVKVRGRCIAAPDKLQMMQEIMFLVRYVLVALFVDSNRIMLMEVRFCFGFGFVLFHFFFFLCSFGFLS